MAENNTTQTTAHIAFRGGSADFEQTLQNWLQRHGDWNVGESIGPDAKNIVSVAVSQSLADTIYLVMKQGDQPVGLYEAVLPPARGSRVSRYIAGEQADTFDRKRRQMAQAGRKVGITPRQLAENGGW